MSSKKIRKVFFVTLSFSEFIKKDLSFLKKHYKVKVGHYRGKRSTFHMLKGTLWSDLTFSWFADIHSFWAVFFSRVFKKKSIVVVGGYDAAKVPEMNYGLALSPVLYHFAKYALKKADRVLTVDESLKKDIIKNYEVSGKNIVTVPTGYDPGFWKLNRKKEELVLSISQINPLYIKIKGIEAFIQCASYFPETKFVVAGPSEKKSLIRLRAMSPPNVIFSGHIPKHELPGWYSRAKVYCQFSRSAGLPNTLCEAMLCECIPVGTPYGGIPTAIGNTGYYVPYGDVHATVAAIRKALQSQNGKKARERIKKLFLLEKRDNKLIQIIEKII